MCEISYEKNGYVTYELQRHETGASAVMNTSVVSVKNGKRIFLAAGNDSDCYIYQIKLHQKDLNHAKDGEETLRLRNSKNADVGSELKSDGENKSLISDLVFDIQTLISVKTDFR